MGSAAELRREHLRQAVLAEDLRLPDLGGHRRAAAQPRDRRPAIRPARRSSRSPRWPRWRAGIDHARHDRSTTPATFKLGTQTYQNAKRRELRPDQHRPTRSRSPRTSSSSSSARGPTTQGPIDPAVGAASSASATRPGSTCPARSPGLVPDAAWRDDAATRSTRRAPSKAHVAAGHDRRRCSRAAASSAPWIGGDNVNLAVGQGDLQATPLQLAVAYSALANGGTIVTPHLGEAIEDGNGAHGAGAPHQARKRKVKIDPSRPQRRSSTACTAPPPSPGGTSADVFKGWPKRLPRSTARPAPPSAGSNPDQAWYACFVKDDGAPDRGRRDGREGRLRRRDRGTRGAPDPLAVVRCRRPTSSTPGRATDPMSAQPIQPASEPPPPLVPREWRLRLDPLLLLATLGLVACSLIALKGATPHDIAGRPAATTSSARRSTPASGSC